MIKVWFLTHLQAHTFIITIIFFLPLQGVLITLVFLISLQKILVFLSYGTSSSPFFSWGSFMVMVTVCQSGWSTCHCPVVLPLGAIS